MQEKLDKFILYILVICVLGVIGIVEKDKLLFYSNSNGKHIVIHIDEVIEDPPTEVENQVFDKININFASKEQLMSLNGIGSKTADNIIDYRTEQSFSSIEEIKNVNGIGDKKFETISQYICVD